MRSLSALLLTVACLPAWSWADVPQFADAPLRAVQFWDEKEGWAVGDDGLILHTIDGGQTWERQPSGVRASLRSVHFIDPFNGCVVGQECLPGGTTTGGVILFTQDGGVKWVRASVRELPGLHRVRFVDRRVGYAVGDASSTYPTGVFGTDDGGATWRAVPGSLKPGWLDGDFARSGGVLVGRWGQLALLHGTDLNPGRVQGLKGQTLRAVQVQGDSAWACGEGGTILARRGASAPWQRLNLQLPQEVERSWDFNALCFVGERGWVVGRPGSVILHTWDGGKSWQAQNTGQPLPLHGVFFLNEKLGWVVGELGTILATQDGGKSWKVQRRGGHRLAVLVITAQGNTLPMGAIAQWGGDEGYLCGVVRVVAPDPASAPYERALDGDRLAARMRRAGGCAADLLATFPLPTTFVDAADAKAFARHWGGSEDEAQGLEELQRQIVLALRIWRPDVIITDCPDPRSPTGQLGALIALCTGKAFHTAARADLFPEQIAKLDLQPWSPSKLYGCWPAEEGASLSVDLAVVRLNLMGTPGEWAARADLLADASATPTASHSYFKLLESALEGAAAHKSVMQEIYCQHGGQARREAPKVNVSDKEFEEIVRSIRQERDFHALMRLHMQDPAKADQLLAGVEQGLSGMPEEKAGQAAFLLAQHCVRGGQWRLAREIYLLLLDRYPEHPLAPAAARWLIAYGASSEARRREELGQFVSQATYSFQAREGTAKEASLPKVRRDRETVLLRRQQEVRAWHKSSLAVAEHMAVYGPLYFADPQVQFCVHAAHRALGMQDKARLWFTEFRLHQTAGPWYDAASTELWLERRIGKAAKPAADCIYTSQAPFLDGKLDEPLWREAKPIVLQNAVGQTSEQYPTEAWLAYDANYLYIALRCRHPRSGHQEQPLRPRQRDMNVAAYDHVSLMLDLDRDYTSYFHFQVDQRGCTHDDCWGDKSWNPRWFVAVHTEEGAWQIEAAIPLIELTGEGVGQGNLWAFNLVRTIPCQGVQSFSVPANTLPRPEGMGLLNFLRRPTQ